MFQFFLLFRTHSFYVDLNFIDFSFFFPHYFIHELKNWWEKTFIFVFLFCTFGYFLWQQGNTMFRPIQVFFFVFNPQSIFFCDVNLNLTFSQWCRLIFFLHSSWLKGKQAVWLRSWKQIPRIFEWEQILETYEREKLLLWIIFVLPIFLCIFYCTKNISK